MEMTHPRCPRGAATALLFHMRLIWDVTTGGQSVIQSDKLPVAGMNHVSAARLLLPVKGTQTPSTIITDVSPVITPDDGSSRPDFGRCHWTTVHVFYVLWRGSLRKKEGCFHVKWKTTGSWASPLPFPLSGHFHPGTKPRLHAALMPIKGLNQAASLQARAKLERRHGRMWPRVSVRTQKISDWSD